ncbi:hypothetical protein AMTR_s00016p00016310 [Amborella trichopoda]|uniref:Uncharacterized protein n=1 Tax=Amborella trichopoda TaxID=13333 RepID=W1PG73_AMBTC|nr:hypothetical protein AMTR_s00016p00016310 [Amborella trichopoda]
MIDTNINPSEAYCTPSHGVEATKEECLEEPTSPMGYAHIFTCTHQSLIGFVRLSHDRKERNALKGQMMRYTYIKDICYTGDPSMDSCCDACLVRRHRKPQEKTLVYVRRTQASADA